MKGGGFETPGEKLATGYQTGRIVADVVVVFRAVPSLTGNVKQVDVFPLIQSQLHGPPCSPFDTIGILFQCAKGIDGMSLFSNLVIALQ